MSSVIPIHRHKSAVAVRGQNLTYLTRQAALYNDLLTEQFENVNLAQTQFCVVTYSRLAIDLYCIRSTDRIRSERNRSETAGNCKRVEKERCFETEVRTEVRFKGGAANRSQAQSHACFTLQWSRAPVGLASLAKTWLLETFKQRDVAEDREWIFH